MKEMGNFEHAAKLVAKLTMLINTDVNVYGFAIPILYPKNLASMVEILGYNCFLQKSKIHHLSKAIHPSPGAGAVLCCELEVASSELDSRSEASGRLAQVTRGAVAVNPPEKKSSSLALKVSEYFFVTKQ